MPIGPDIVLVFKHENASTGGKDSDEDTFYKPKVVKPLEDAIKTAGGYVCAPGEADDNGVAYYRHEGYLRLLDKDGNFNARLYVHPHEASHNDGGTDELTLQLMGSSDAVADRMLKSDGVGGWLVVDGVPGYPPELEIEELIASQQTTFTTYQQRMRLTTADLPLGDYMIFMQCVIGGTLSSTVAAARFQYEDTDTLMETVIKTGDPSGQIPMSTMTRYENISGSKILDIDYKLDGGGGAARIEQCRAIIWRVA
jgi:hypothetical protein